MPALESHHLVIAGAGGNTGSHLLAHLARMPGVGRLTLVDPDIYEPRNLAVQNIEGADIGLPKVEAQAARLKRIRPGLQVVALQQRIEDVPRGSLQCGLFVSCLDSRSARQHLNELAWRLGVGWIDCGVLGSQDLVRVSAYSPGLDSPCLECSWNPGEHGDYAALEQEYLCGAGAGAAFPTMASSALGALAASLMAVEVAKLLAGVPTGSLVSRQFIFDACHHTAQVTTERRNPYCRFDHGVWRVEPWMCPPAATTLRDALGEIGSLQVEGHRFASEMICPGCGHRQNALRLNRPLARCPQCNRRMASQGFGSLERLTPSLVRDYLHLTLADIGLHAGDIVSSGSRHRLLLEAA